MKAETYVAILRTHGEYVARLATELTTTLRVLEELLPNEAHNPDTRRSHTEKIAGLHRLLTTEADLFCRRLKVFLEGTSTPRMEELLVSHTSTPSLNTGEGAEATVLQQAPSRSMLQENSPLPEKVSSSDRKEKSDS